MTIISEPIADIAGAAETDPIVFFTRVLRQNEAGTGTVTTDRHHYVPDGGVLMTGDLDPGPAQVRIGTTTYPIEIPDSATPIRLWPLIDATITPSPSNASGYVKDAGHVARIQSISQADYAALATYDPDTLYVITS